VIAYSYFYSYSYSIRALDLERQLEPDSRSRSRSLVSSRETSSRIEGADQSARARAWAVFESRDARIGYEYKFAAQEVAR